MSFNRRPDIQALIGEKAEFLVHTFCVMDLASLDATMDVPSGKHQVLARKQHGSYVIALTDQQYRDLITVQLADWLEQVHSSALALRLDAVIVRFGAATTVHFCILYVFKM